MDSKITKRLTRDKSYVRPKQTYQDTMTNNEIKDKLKDYKKVSNIMTVPINTHLRYMTLDKNGKKVFRLGGMLTKIDPEGKYVVLSNGTLSWSAQIKTSQFWQKMTEKELKEEYKKEIITECNPELEEENKDLKKENKELYKKLELLTNKMHSIEVEISKHSAKKSSHKKSSNKKTSKKKSSHKKSSKKKKL